MLTAIARLINPRKRREAPAPLRARSPRTNNPSDDAERNLARSLAESIDQAVDRRQRHRLNVLTDAALRIAHRHPHLTERLARLRLADDDADGALSLIDALSDLPSSLRLLRSACLIQAGRRAEAHQDLCRWCHDRSAPINARLMAALLDWEAGDVESADAALRQNLRQLETGDERTLMAALCLAVDRNNTERVTALAQQLRQCTAGRHCSPDVDVLMGTLGVAAPATTTQLSDPQIDDFVTELIAAEATIPALVESLQIKPDRAIATMLTDAIERALPELGSETTGIEALVRLHLLLDRCEESAAWLQRGLQSNPMSAALVLLRQELEQRDAPTPTLDDLKRAQRTIETRAPHRSKAA